jgi:hypothetical protein
MLFHNRAQSFASVDYLNDVIWNVEGLTVPTAAMEIAAPLVLAVAYPGSRRAAHSPEHSLTTSSTASATPAKGIDSSQVTQWKRPL